MSDKNVYEYMVSSKHFEDFNVKVKDGVVVWCSDGSHPMGAKWNVLAEYYRNATWGVEVKEIKEEGNEE